MINLFFRYDGLPNNLMTSLVNEQPITHSNKTMYERVGATNKTASNNMALLGRYLHHKRWVWGVQAPAAPAISQQALNKILDTLKQLVVVLL